MPSGTKLKYLCKDSNFTIQNWSRKSRMGQQGVDQSMYIMHVTHDTKHAKVIFQSVKPFLCVLKLMPSDAKSIYLFKGPNFAI